MVVLCSTIAMSAGIDNVKCGEESFMHHVVDRVYISDAKESSEIHLFRVDNVLFYNGFCDDFGPMGLGSVFEFCNILEQELKQHPNRKVALSTPVEKQALTNALFLMGSYLIMKCDWTVAEVKACFQPLKHHLASFRDVSPGKQNFHLYVEDCWGGLLRAKQLGWVDFEPSGFQADEYRHYDDPLNADLHEIVPNKFVAMRGPRTTLGGSSFFDHVDSNGEFSHRDFSPSYYAEILKEFRVCAVVRLNSPEYSDEEFGNAGIAVADLQFDDCTAPPVDVVAKFLIICEKLPGAIAVHCKAGLGRTGTLIALYLMKHYDFSAREAMGWLRIVRPGSVIGEQQRFLCEREAVMHRAGAVFRNKACNATATIAREPATTSPLINTAVPVSAVAPPADAADAAAVAAQKIIEETVQSVDLRIKNMVHWAAGSRRRGSIDGRGGVGGGGICASGGLPNLDSLDVSCGAPGAGPAAAAAAKVDGQMRREEVLGVHVMSASNARVARRAASDLGLHYAAAVAAAAGRESPQEIDPGY